MDCRINDMGHALLDPKANNSCKQTNYVSAYEFSTDSTTTKTDIFHLGRIMLSTLLDFGSFKEIVDRAIAKQGYYEYGLAP